MAVITQLVVDRFGAFVGKHSERIVVSCKGETLIKASLLHLEAIYVMERGISFSADALEICCERGIPIFFLNAQGEPYASVYAPGLGATVITRREQLRAYDNGRGAWLARQMAAAKVQNQASTLKYLAKNRKDTPEGEALQMATLDLNEPLAALEHLPDGHVDELRDRVMGIEGNAARIYWGAARCIVPQSYGWTTRETRGAGDAVNSLLNYGYGILYGDIERALMLAGLDPYAGFIHADRPGKPSMVLDFIEEFRQIAVDRVVFGLVARNFTVGQAENRRLTDETRRTYAEHVLKRLESGVRYRGERHALRHVIQMQARHLAAFLRGDTDEYLPFLAEW